MCAPLTALVPTALLATLAAGCSGGVGQALSSGCLAGCETAPVAATSASRRPVRDPGKPAADAGLTMVWLHHSTGDRLLQGGLRAGIEDNNIAFFDINYHEARVDGYVIGDHTDPPDFPAIFNDARRLETVITWELPDDRQHDIVMFKSCFPASNITSDEELQNRKRLYSSLLPTFRAHPEILFIPMSTPPLVRSRTTPAAAARARAFARWLTTAYAADLPSVQAFDLFDALAVRPGHDGANTLVPQYAASPSDSHPSRAGGRAVTRLFVPWLNQAIRRAGLVRRK
jgi:hypothetical protein